jgi:hypothetical protein
MHAVRWTVVPLQLLLHTVVAVSGCGSGLSLRWELWPGWGHLHLLPSQLVLLAGWGNVPWVGSQGVWLSGGQEELEQQTCSCWTWTVSVWGVGRHEAHVTEVQVGPASPGPVSTAVTLQGYQPG